MWIVVVEVKMTRKNKGHMHLLTKSETDNFCIVKHAGQGSRTQSSPITIHSGKLGQYAAFIYSCKLQQFCCPHSFTEIPLSVFWSFSMLILWLAQRCWNLMLQGRGPHVSHTLQVWCCLECPLSHAAISLATITESNIKQVWGNAYIIKAYSCTFHSRNLSSLSRVSWHIGCAF